MLLKGRIMARHRRKPARRYIKQAAVSAGAMATAAAMTVGAAAPPAIAAGPDYTQLITDNSNSLDNILFIKGNVGGAAASFWNPIANAIPGGLLPTFTADVEQLDLTSLTGLAQALSQILPLPVPDLSAVPGLPADATALITAGLLPGLAVAVPVDLPQVLSTLLGLGTVDGVLTLLGNIPLLEGVPALSELIPGFTVTGTTFDSSYDWPLLGLGPILGLNGSTTISNTFAQLPSLTGAALAANILSLLTYNGGGALPPLVQATVNAILSPLNSVSTPSVTASIPLGQGTYGLPLGGQIGWLATAPTLSIGPVPLLSDTDTVISVPISAFGGVAPLGLASFGYVVTPGIVFPTATGASTLGGTSLTSFAIPGLGFSVTNLNILSSTYVGTNGINWNSGTSVLTLTTPFGALPIVYSLGAFNIGTTGFGFTLPSLFTIGLMPPFQIGTAPTQQSPDGLIPADVLNLGLGIPTQTNDLVTLLGLPDLGNVVEAVLNPLFNALVAPIGAVITNSLNNVVGPVTNGLASITEQVTALIAEITGGGPPAQTTLAATTFAADDEQEQTVADDGGSQTDLTTLRTDTDTDTDMQAAKDDDEPKDPADEDGPRLNVVTQTGNPSTDPADDTDLTDTDSRNQLTETVNESTETLTDTVTDTTDDAGEDLSEVESAEDSTNETASAGAGAM